MSPISFHVKIDITVNKALLREKGDFCMKKMKSSILGAVLCLVALLAFGKPVSAKTYYNSKFNYWGTEVSMNQKAVASLMADYNSKTVSKKADFDKNGKKETVKLKLSDTSVTVYINGKKVASGSKKYAQMAEFKTYRIGKNTFAVLLYGEEDMQGGNGKIYRWSGNKLKLLKSCSAGGELNYLDIGVKSGKIIVKNQKQLYHSAWNSTLKSKYDTYYNLYNATSGVTVTRTYYTKYVYSSGKLKKSSTDLYYRCTNAYD